MAVAKRVAELEQQLARTRAERDELLRDVENLCMQGDPGTVFDKSSLLAERVAEVNGQLAQARQKLEEAAAERADLQADLAGVRESKLVADREARSARGRTAHLEQELSFYQAQSASAMADRDTAAWEAEQQRARNSELEAQLQASRAGADQQRAAKDDAQAALARARSRIDELTEQVKGLEIIPGLQRDLRQARQRADQLEVEGSALQDSLGATQKQLSEAREAFEVTAADNHVLAARLAEAGDREAALQSEVSQLQDKLQQAEDRGDDLAQQLDTATEQITELERQADVQTAAVNGAREALESAAQQKVAALVSLSDAQAAQGRAEERLEAARRRADALAARLEQAGGADGTVASGTSTPAAQSPQRPGWRGWLAPAKPVGVSPNSKGGEADDGSSAWSEGVSSDVHTLRGQLATANERLAAVDAMAARVAGLRTSLATITAAANWEAPNKQTLTELDKLAEEAATLRVGLVLGLGNGKQDAGDSDDEGDMFTALAGRNSGKRASPTSSIGREVLDLLEVAIAAVRARAAQGLSRASSLMSAPSAALSRSASQAAAAKG